jgi:hypothetical protein
MEPEDVVGWHKQVRLKRCYVGEFRERGHLSVDMSATCMQSCAAPDPGRTKRPSQVAKWPGVRVADARGAFHAFV